MRHARAPAERANAPGVGRSRDRVAASSPQLGSLQDRVGNRGVEQLLRRNLAISRSPQPSGELPIMREEAGPSQSPPIPTGTHFDINFFCDSVNRTRQFAVSGSTVSITSRLHWDRAHCNMQYQIRLQRVRSMWFDEDCGAKTFPPDTQSWTGLTPGSYYLVIEHAAGGRCCLTGTIDVT